MKKLLTFIIVLMITFTGIAYSPKPAMAATLTGYRLRVYNEMGGTNKITNVKITIGNVSTEFKNLSTPDRKFFDASVPASLGKHDITVRVTTKVSPFLLPAISTKTIHGGTVIKNCLCTHDVLVRACPGFSYGNYLVTR